MKYKVVAFEKHPIAGQDYTQAVAGETVGILLEPVHKKADFKAYVTYVLDGYILPVCKQGNVNQ